MKSKQEIIQGILRFLAKRILQKYKPRIVGVTGSVGKSTTKEMIFQALKGNFFVRRNEKNYNNEIGIPLTIIGASGEKKNIIQWLAVFLKASGLIIFTSKYPEILILELAVDHPGDMKYFCEFIPIEVGILTNVGISHLENFKTKEALFAEKSYLLKRATGLVVYNGDNLDEKEFKSATKKMSYGINNNVDFRIKDIKYNYNRREITGGMTFEVAFAEKTIPGKLNKLMGRPYLYAVLVGLVVADYFKLNQKNALVSMEDMTVIPGRMCLLEGINNSSIIDDTYNSAPASVKEALLTINKIEATRKIIILGDMLELGEEEAREHRAVGKSIAEMEDVIFVAVGKRMKLAVDEFKKITMSKKRVYWFEDSLEAITLIKSLIRSEDVVLVKGSQGMRMERIIEIIMNEPDKKKKLLVRQDRNWKN